jgi:hypothetical protein
MTSLLFHHLTDTTARKPMGIRIARDISNIDPGWRSSLATEHLRQPRGHGHTGMAGSSASHADRRTSRSSNRFRASIRSVSIRRHDDHPDHHRCSNALDADMLVYTTSHTLAPGVSPLMFSNVFLDLSTAGVHQNGNREDCRGFGDRSTSLSRQEQSPRKPTRAAPGDT